MVELVVAKIVGVVEPVELKTQVVQFLLHQEAQLMEVLALAVTVHIM